MNYAPGVLSQRPRENAPRVLPADHGERRHQQQHKVQEAAMQQRQEDVLRAGRLEVPGIRVGRRHMGVPLLRGIWLRAHLQHKSSRGARSTYHE